MEFVNQRSEDEVILRCNCGSDHFVALSRYAEGIDGQWGSITVTANYRPNERLWGRIKMAVHLLRGGCPWTGDAGLTPNDLIAVRDWCDRTIHWGLQQPVEESR